MHLENDFPAQTGRRRGTTVVSKPNFRHTSRSALGPILLILAVSCVAGRASAQMPAVRVVVGEARVVKANPTISLVGTVEPARRSRVSSELAGLVIDMPVRQGDIIPAGGVICKLNQDTLSLRLAAERAKLLGVRARHEELIAGTRPEELVRLKALLDETVAEFDGRRFEMERVQRLFDAGESNNKEYQDTRATFLAAERRKIATEAAYKLGLEGPRKEIIAQAMHDVARQQAITDRIESDLGKSIIRAPFAGHIVRREIEVGEWISEGDTVVELVELETVLVRVNVPESVLPFISKGDAVRVTVDAVSKSFAGRIKHIVRQADPNARTFPVEIEVDNHEGSLAAGMFARSTMPSGSPGDAIAVPQDAIVMRDRISYVAIVVPGREGGSSAILSPVSVGMDIDDWITITSGNLLPGTLVITRGTERILPFPTPIEIVDERGTPVAMPTPKDKAPHSDKVAAPAGDA